MWKSIIIVKHRNCATEAQKRQKQWNLGKPDLRGKKRKTICDVYQFPGCEHPDSGRQQAPQIITECEVGKKYNLLLS